MAFFFRRGQVPISFDIFKIDNSSIGIKIFCQVFDKANILELPRKELKNYLFNDKNQIITFNYIIFKFVRNLIKQSNATKYMLKKYVSQFDTHIDKCAEDLRKTIFEMINDIH